MVAIKKAKPGTGKFSKPVQMRPEDYNSSSSDEEDHDMDENRLSDDSEFDLSDDDGEDNVSGGSDEEDIADEDDEEDDEEEDEEDIKEDVKADDEDGDLDEDMDDAAEDESNSGDESDADVESDDANDKTEGNASWAKSLAKILKQEKPKNKKSVVLSKAKTTSEILEARDQAKAIGFTIEGEIKEEKPDVAELDEAIEAKKKKKTLFSLRIKPTMMDRERERAFKKIATKGVVQLFNAVRAQQKDLVQKLDSAGRLDHKRDAVLNNIDKRKFLDVLMGGPKAKSENVDNPVKDEESDMDDEVYNDGLPKNSIWSVLKEDFLSNKKLSHWDKDEEEDEQRNTDQSDGDDDDSD